MWPFLTAVLFLPLCSSNSSGSMFSKDKVIFTSSYDIVKILVQADDNMFLQGDATDLPSIFFTVESPHFEAGTCIYVLEDLAAYEILEGGRDSTADYGSDKNIYFGARDGVYKYDKGSLSAKKVGPYKDDIIQLQKANGTDKIYYLTEEKKLYTLESNGTVKTKVNDVVCANQFVLDTSNNIYFVECNSNLVYILKAKKSIRERKFVPEEFSEIKLLRPAFVMDECVPLLGDGKFYLLYINGTLEAKDLSLEETISAISIDTALYIVVAYDKKIYEYNLMDVLVKTMYGLGYSVPKDINRMITSVIDFKDIFVLNNNNRSKSN